MRIATQETRRSWAVLSVLTCSASIVMVTGCAAKPRYANVEVLASIRELAPGDAWTLEAAAYRATYDALAANDSTRVVVTPISDNSLSEVPLLDAVSPHEGLFGMNERDARLRRTALTALANAALSELGQRTTGRGRTEIINAIFGAANRFESVTKGARNLLVILSSGFEQSSILNMADYRLTLNSNATLGRVLEHLKATGQVVDLRGTDVCMIGITSGDGHWADFNRSRGVRRFWQRYFADSGANLVGYGTDIQSCRALANEVGS
ncbi:MAG TPA: hypothetical protein VIJ12_02360 [Candidatus Baltobacteraceae bacterium]